VAVERFPARALRTGRAAAGIYGRSAAGQRASAISYHVLFSLVPFFALLLSVLELVLPASTHERVVAWLVGIGQLPEDLSTSVARAIEHAGPAASAAGVVALVGFVWAAGGMMAAVRSAFRAVWETDATRPYVRGKLLDIALVLGAGVLVVAAFGLTVAVQVATETSVEVAEELGAVAQLAASLALSFVAFALVYRVVPPVPTRLRAVLPAAALAAVGVHLAGAGFSVYLRHLADFDDVYGPLGAVLAFLLLVWVTATVLLVGACVIAASPEPV
jgi:membrane protein